MSEQTIDTTTAITTTNNNNEKLDITRYTIVIASRRYSSWSMRGYLALRYIYGLNGFNTIEVKIAGMHGSIEDKIIAKNSIKKYNSSGKVPCLIDNYNNIVVGESLAICLKLAEENNKLLPSNIKYKYNCIAACCEMSTSFLALRSNWPFNCLMKGTKHGELTLATVPELKEDINRLNELWDNIYNECSNNGLYLYGNDLTIADIFFIPVAIRFNTYDTNLTSLNTITSKNYIKNLLNHELTIEWIENALLENKDLIIPSYELYHD